MSQLTYDEFVSILQGKIKTFDSTFPNFEESDRLDYDFENDKLTKAHALLTRLPWELPEESWFYESLSNAVMSAQESAWVDRVGAIFNTFTEEIPQLDTDSCPQGLELLLKNIGEENITSLAPEEFEDTVWAFAGIQENPDLLVQDLKYYFENSRPSHIMAEIKGIADWYRTEVEIKTLSLTPALEKKVSDYWCQACDPKDPPKVRPSATEVFSAWSIEDRSKEYRLDLFGASKEAIKEGTLAQWVRENKPKIDNLDAVFANRVTITGTERTSRISTFHALKSYIDTDDLYNCTRQELYQLADLYERMQPALAKSYDVNVAFTEGLQAAVVRGTILQWSTHVLDCIRAEQIGGGRYRGVAI